MAELVDDSGECNVEDLTIGREGYGSIFFPGITDVTNLNFDEIGKASVLFLNSLKVKISILVSVNFSVCPFSHTLYTSNCFQFCQKVIPSTF